jgi:16S rRNA (adenine1518-N6/adenine1519-N6)-dimethyltransferase
MVAIDRLAEPAVPPDVDRARVFALVRAGFQQRRKMLRRSLAALVDADAFAAAGIRPEARAEELGIAEWVALARVSPGAGASADA